MLNPHRKITADILIVTYSHHDGFMPATALILFAVYKRASFNKRVLDGGISLSR